MSLQMERVATFVPHPLSFYRIFIYYSVLKLQYFTHIHKQMLTFDSFLVADRLEGNTSVLPTDVSNVYLVQYTQVCLMALI